MTKGLSRRNNMFRVDRKEDDLGTLIRDNEIQGRMGGKTKVVDSKGNRGEMGGKMYMLAG